MKRGLIKQGQIITNRAKNDGNKMMEKPNDENKISK